MDNIDLIIPLLSFDNGDDFYYLQILQRKKENPHLGSNSRVIKNYYVNSLEYLMDHYEEIKELCNFFNARASLRLNRRSYEKVALKTMVNIANSVQNREYIHCKKSYSRAVGMGNIEPKKSRTWILDWDGEFTTHDKMGLEVDLRYYSPEGSKVVAYIPSKSGMHIIVRPFDSREFKVKYPEIEIHKDNPTNLYISR